MKTFFESETVYSRKYTIYLTTFFVLLFLFTGTSTFGQEENEKQIEIPIAVQNSFEKDFPSENPVWTKDFGGNNSDYLRFNANFKSKNIETLAVYDQLGNLKVVMVSIQINELPKRAVEYLKNEYKNFTITQAAKVRNDKNETKYEVGIIMGGEFYDAVFDNEGYFLTIINKNKLLFFSKN